MLFASIRIGISIFVQNLIMGFFRFLFSKTFLYQLLFALLAVILICFIGLQWLNFRTNHDQRIAVPNLEKLTLEKAQNMLDEKDLVAQVQDSANFNPDYPPFSVIEQNPKAGNFVKQNRKIYLVLNPSNYRKLKVPRIVQKTRRQAEPTLRALDFKVGKIIYRPNMARDVVLELQHRGKVVKPGDLLMKTSTIDLVVGDGTR